MNVAARYFTLMTLAFIASFLLLPSSKAVNNVFYIFLAFPALVLILLGKAQRPQASVLVGLWAAFFVWLVLNGIGADSRFFKDVSYTLLFCLSIGLWVDHRRFASAGLFRVFFWGLILYVGGSAVVFWLTGQHDPGTRLYALPGRMQGPILSSMLIVSCFALLLPVWLGARRWLEMTAAVVAVLFCAGFVLQSRSGLVGLAVVLGVAWAVMLWQGHWRQRTVLLLIATLIIGALAWLLQHSELATELVVRADSGRFELWCFYIKDWLDCGLLQGCGTGFTNDIWLEDGQLVEHPHNIFLAMGFYHGLPGLLLFTLIMLATLRQAWKQRNPWGGYLLVALFMLNFDGRQLINSPHEGWLLVLLPSMLIAARQRAQKNRRVLGVGGAELEEAD